MPPPPGGFPQQPWTPGPPPGVGAAPGNNLAIAALVVGILSMFICWPAGLVAIGLGIAGLRASRGLPDQKGKGLAIGGIVTGAIGALLGVAILLLVVIGASTSSDINSDPSDGFCNQDRFLQDPDC